MTFTHALSSNNYGPAKFIVDASAANGTHTTIASALTSASSGDTIFIRPGTYTENLTLKAGVNLTAYVTDAFGGTVKIIGKASFSSAGTVNISGIRLQTNSDFLLSVTGSAASIVFLTNCYLNCTNNTGIQFTTSNASAIIECTTCSGDLGTTGIGYHTMSSTGAISYLYCIFGNSGGSTTASSSSAGSVNVWYTDFGAPLSASGGTLGLISSIMNTSPQNATAITTSTAGGHTIQFCAFASGSASCISIGASTQVTIENSIFDSTNANAITGAGTCSYQCLSFPNSSKTINTTTQNVSGTLYGSTTTAPTAGFLGEVIQSTASAGSVSLSTNTPKTITSITLTAGNWLVSGAIEYSGSAGSGNVCWCSVSTTTNTLATTANTSFQVGPGPLSGTYDQCSYCPDVSMLVTTSTNVFLVGQITISAGSITAGGRITAVRIG